MFWPVLQKDLRLFVSRGHYAIFLVVVFVAMSGATAIGMLRYQVRSEEHVRWIARHKDSIAQIAHPVSLTGPGITQSFPPQPLSILAVGADDLISAPFATTSWHKQEIFYANDRGPIASFVQNLDFSFVLFFLVPLFILYVCLAWVLDEFESRTFLSNVLFNVSPACIFLSKFLSAVACVAGPVLFFYAVSVMTIARATSFTSEQYLRSIVLAVPVLLNILFWVGLTLSTQIVWRTQRSSCAGSILLWVAIVFLLPQLGLAFAREGHPLADNAAYYQARGAIFEKYMASLSLKRFNNGDAFIPAVRTQEELLNNGTEAVPLERLRAYHGSIVDSLSLLHFSAYYLSCDMAATLANTGLGDYVSFRSQMIAYRRVYGEIIAKVYYPWLETRTFPREAISKLWSYSFHRIDLTASLESIRGPLFGLALLVLFSTAAFLGVAPWIVERCIHDL